MFPLFKCGGFTRSKATISDTRQFLPDFLLRASRALEAARARNIQVLDDRISFTGGMFRFVSNWNILGQVGYGQIYIKEASNDFVISYYISFRQMLVVVSVMVGAFLGPFLFFNNVEGLPIVGKIVLLVVAWLFMFGANWLIAIIRFPSLVKNMVWGDSI